MAVGLGQAKMRIPEAIRTGGTPALQEAAPPQRFLAGRGGQVVTRAGADGDMGAGDRHFNFVVTGRLVAGRAIPEHILRVEFPAD